MSNWLLIFLWLFIRNVRVVFELILEMFPQVYSFFLAGSFQFSSRNTLSSACFFTTGNAILDCLSLTDSLILLI